MSCPMNPQKFWGIPYKGSHHFRHVNIRLDSYQFGFIVTLDCENCGENFEELHSWRSLERAGYDTKKIKANRIALKKGVSPKELK